MYINYKTKGRISVKKFIFGFIAGIIIAVSVTAFAETNGTIDVIFDRVKLVINGQQSDAKTILYDGYTYIQLRHAAAAFGASLDWDAGTNTAYLNTPGSAPNGVTGAPVPMPVPVTGTPAPMPLSSLPDDIYQTISK